MTDADANVDSLLKAREEINEELRRLKSSLTVLFTDVVGSTAYFDRYGDTAGVAMLHSHIDVVSDTIESFHGRVVKTIGDSVMAEFPDPKEAVQAAVSIQRRQFELNQQLTGQKKIQMRIGINTGVGFRKAGDVYGDVVNLAARLTKRSGPAQILVSGAVQEGSGEIEGILYHHLGKVTVEGRTDKDELYEVIWTEPGQYAELRRTVSTALMKGEHAVGGQSVAFPATGREKTTDKPDVLFPTPLPAPAALSVRYDLLEEVGQGGMGIVYKARDRETGDLVALKLLKPEVAADQKIMERFKNELRLARQITHKNICRIYEFNRVEGTACISMEYVEGESLRSILNRFGALSVRKAVEVIRQVCWGLSEAHNQGVIHRDLKPENIMVDSGGNIKIMDFGIARSVYAPATKSGQAIGTPAYMAPEQAECKPVDSRTDVYAVGLVLFEVLTGTRAFHGETAAQVAFKQVNEAPPLLRQIDPTLPAEMEEVIARCLDKNPDNRFPSCQALDETLAALVEGGELPKELPTAKTGATTTVTLRFSPDWRPGGAMVTAIVVVLLLIGWGSWQLIKPSPAARPPAGDTAASIPPSGPPVQEKQERNATPVQAEITSPRQTPAAQRAAVPSLAASPPPRQATTQPSAQPLPPDRAVKDAEKQEPEVIAAPPPNQTPAEETPSATPPADMTEDDGKESETTRPPVTPPEVTTPSADTSEPTETTAAVRQVYLQVRIYKSERDAVRLREQLEGMSFPVQLLPPPDGSGNYRVRVGPFESLDLARAAQRRLEARGYKSTLQIGEL